MPEDRALLRSNLSAGMWVSGKGGAKAHHSFLFPAPLPSTSPFYGNRKALNLGGPGAKSPAARNKQAKQRHCLKAFQCVRCSRW